MSRISRATSVDGCRRSNAERARTDVRSALQNLEADFSREGNPVYAWKALTLVRRCGIIHLPAWVQDYFGRAADGIMEIANEVTNGKGVGREAERVGKALGFGTDGPGQGGWFKRATILERDRRIYLKVEEKLAAGIKLDFAYDEVAKDMNVSRSTVQRGYKNRHHDRLSSRQTLKPAGDKVS